MVTKQRRYHNYQERYDVCIEDRNGNKFTMMIGGNGDLYWVPENYKKCTTFYIDGNDKLFYGGLKKLFKLIKERDDKYSPTLKGDEFTFISEDYHEDYANVLKIVKNEKEFIIDFIKNENTDFTVMRRLGCNICFCNSGSRVPRVEQLFAIMFNELAYYVKSVEIVDKNL